MVASDLFIGEKSEDVAIHHDSTLILKVVLTEMFSVVSTPFTGYR